MKRFCSALCLLSILLSCVGNTFALSIETSDKLGIEDGRLTRMNTLQQTLDTYFDF